MTTKSRKVLLAALRPMYSQVSWTEKQQILDGFVAATGYNRKHAIVLLNGSSKAQETAKSRARKYDREVSEALIAVWRASNRICSKRLIPFLPTIIASLEKFGHLKISSATKEKLLTMGHSSVDRLLKEERKKYAKRKSTTRPGYLIKKHIPIRTYSDWSDTRPGFFEADLVAHGGSSAHGQFLQTLTMTDIATGWTECSALICKSEVSVLRAFADVREHLPFDLLGLDTDNGSEFINYAVLDWCKENSITFTRSREYKKNDQAHVEEKNGSIVRRLIGYDRFEGEGSCTLLGQLYRVARLYINFFQPSLKLCGKKREGGNVKRIYEKAATPLQRVIGSNHIDEQRKKKLRRLFQTLDPVLLLTELERLQEEFWKTSVPAQEYASQIALKQLVRATSEAKEKKQPPTPKRPKRARVWMPTAQYPGKKKGAKTTLDEVWEEVCAELHSSPDMTPREVLADLERKYPGRFRVTQINTISDKIKAWRYQNSLPIEFRKLKPGRKTNIGEVWELAMPVLAAQPNISARGLHRLLMERFPDQVTDGQRTSIVVRMKRWRKENPLPSNGNEISSISIFDEALSLVGQKTGY